MTPPLGTWVAYFLRLGTFGFGGPIALAAAMRHDLVEQRGWITDAEYKEGLALAQLAPGPLAAQLAMYLGWIRAGLLGATLVARFGLDDPALAAVGEIVHDIDCKDEQFGRPETQGVARLLRGIADGTEQDEERLQRGGRLFDDLYAAFTHRAG